jgi:chromosome segregation ATPase
MTDAIDLAIAAERDVHSLRNRIAQLEAKLAEVERERDALRSGEDPGTGFLVADLTSARDRIAELERNYERAKQGIALVERERDAAIQRATDNGAAAAAWAEVLDREQYAARKMDEQYNRLQSERDKANEIVAMLTSETKRDRDRIAQLEGELREAREAADRDFNELLRARAALARGEGE